MVGDIRNPRNPSLLKTAPSAAKLLPTGVIAPKIAIADLRVGRGLRVRLRVRQSKNAGGQEGDGRDEGGVLHGELEGGVSSCRGWT